MRREVGTVCLALLTTVLPGTSHAPPQPIVALAPVEVLLDGRNDLVGVAVDAAGTAYVSDGGSGHVYRLAAGGALTLAASNLDRPAGLAFDLEGRLLVAEEKGGRILRLEPGGSITVVATGIRTPRWIAVSPSGALYVSAHRLADLDGQDAEEGREIVLVQPGVGVTVVAAGIRRLEGLVLHDDAVIAATMGLEDGPDVAGALLRFPALAGGALGPAELWLGIGLNQPVGLAADALGAVYVSSHLLTDIPERARRAVGKVHPDVRLSGFADNLDNPRGLALGPDGSLYVADGRSGRLVRFLAPPEPVLEPVPEHVAEPSVQLRGTAVAGARVDVATEQEGFLAVATADATGAFSVATTLGQNTVNELLVLATPHQGDGLTGVPATVGVTHDDQAPAVTLPEPAGAFLRQTVTVRAAATDGGSGVLALAILLDGQAVATASNPDPTQPFIATVSIDTSTREDGTHTLGAVADDRAGNRGSTSRSVIVDNTPPDTEITDGPAGTGAAGTATFAFTGSDNLTPVAGLVFAWRVDGGAWSPFAAETTAALGGLAPGAHAFEVRARDLAGNEDPTPARRPFTLGAGVQVTIVEPADGASVPEGPVLVRGTVAAGGQEVAVTVNGVPAALHRDAFAAMVGAEPGPLVLSALATTLAGASAEDSVAVTVVESSTPLVDLRVSPTSGVAPLAAAFSLPGIAGGVVDLDADGDGLVDFTGPALAGHVHTFPLPGLYVATATVTDDQGVRFVRRAVVEVLDRVAADGLFRARWATFRDGLASADVEGALALVVEGRRAKYRGALQALAPDLPTIAGGLSDMTVLSFGEHVVEGVVTRVRDGATHLHFVYFMRDDDGIWKIVEM